MHESILTDETSMDTSINIDLQFEISFLPPERSKNQVGTDLGVLDVDLGFQALQNDRNCRKVLSK